MKDICAATNRVCNKCNPGKCNYRVVRGEKPISFSMERYRQAIKDLEEIKRVNKTLENEIISQRICINNLKSEISFLRENGPTVTRLIEEVKNKMCSFCVKKEECENALDTGLNYPCEMDLL